VILTLLIVVLVLIFCFTLTNGFLDGGGLVSPVIATRAMEPLPALLLMAFCEMVGLLLLGRAVVATLGHQLISFPTEAHASRLLVVLAVALSVSLVWNLSMWKMALPSSSSHALLGGLIGSVWMLFGWESLNTPLMIRILLGLVCIPLIAALVSFVFSRFLFWIGAFMTPAVNGTVRTLQIMALAGVSLAHGSNDGQKSLALVLLAVAAWQGVRPENVHAPLWVVVACGSVLAIGLVLGSRRTIQTVGTKFYRIQNLQGLSAGMTTMGLVSASSLTGFPMSSTHVMSSAVLGAGAAVRIAGVRWNLAGDIGLAWVLTVPATTGLSAGLGYVVSKAI